MSLTQTVPVWDPLVRTFHWTLVPAFVIAYLSGEEILDLDVLAGYLIGGLVGFRVLWGLIGTSHARFSDFVRAPATVRAYLRSLLSGRPQHYLGHNPAGGAMMVQDLRRSPSRQDHPRHQDRRVQQSRFHAR